MDLLGFAWENPVATVVVVAAALWGVLLVLQQQMLAKEVAAFEDVTPTPAEAEPVPEDNRFAPKPKKAPEPPPPPPPDLGGKLNEADGRLMQLLLDMAGFVTDREITQQHGLTDVAEVAQRPELASALLAQAYSNWAAVHTLLLRWAHQKFEADGGASAEAVSSPEKLPAAGGLLKAFARRAKAPWEDPALWSSKILEAVESDVAHWGRQRVSGRFYLVSEGPNGEAYCVQHKGDKYTCYAVLGVSQSVGDALRATGGALPAQLLLTLLPFQGKLVADGAMEVEGYRGGKGLEKRLQEAVAQALEAGTLVRALELPPRSEGSAAAAAAGHAPPATPESESPKKAKNKKKEKPKSA